MRRKAWSAEDDALMRELYPDNPTAVVSARVGHSLSSTSQRAQALGLKKSAQYLRTPAAGRIQPGEGKGVSGRFMQGHVPANKGLRRPGWAPGRMAETQFRKGDRKGIAARNWRPVGTILTDGEGYQRIKIREAQPGEAYGFGNCRIWPFLHRHLWATSHGPIPPHHAVVFINGNKSDVRIENLQLLTRGELMARNTIHNLPKPLASTLQLLGALKRQIRKKTRAHDPEQDRTPAQPSLRNPRGTEGRREADGH